MGRRQRRDLPDQGRRHRRARRRARHIQLNAPFTYGVALSGLSAEGAAPASDWSRWQSAGRAPAANDGSGWLTDFADDARIFRSLGFTAVRLTLEWARLEPRPGRVDGEATERYLQVLQACRSAGLATWITLQHTTLPGWFADDERGFRDERSRGYFWPRHVDRCAEVFEPFAAAWVPIDDPTGWALRSHLLGTRPPGVRDPELARAALIGAIDANHRAGALLRGTSAPVICTVKVNDAHQRNPNDVLDAAAWAYLSALGTGRFEMRGQPALDVAQLIGTFDAIGVAHDARDSAAALADCAQRAAELAGERAVLIAANGVAGADDEPRERYLRDALAAVAELRREFGLAGYFYEPGIDGYDPDTGFAAPRGLIARDRALKPSANLTARAIGGAGS